jgi:hypothetical protein
MNHARQPTRRPVPRRRRAGRAAVLALAVLTVLALPAAGSQRALAVTARTLRPASTAVAAPARARLAVAAPSPFLSPQAAPAASSGGCGLFDVTCYVSSAITGWFAGLVRSAVNPLLALIGQSALSTPQPGSIPAVHTMWATSLAVADACYVLLVLLGAIVVMTHESVQTSYSVKEIAPRIVLGFLGANLSMAVISQAITIANGLSAALAGHGVDPSSAARSLLDTLASAATGQDVFLVLLALAGVILALVLAAVYVMRLMAVVLLAAAAPLCLALYALPQTAWAARWWWRALTAALTIQVAQGLVLTAAAQVFFTPSGWLPWPAGNPERILITLCLLWILMRIPFWIARPVLSPSGHSPLRRAARFAVTAAVLSRIAPVLSGRQPRPSAGAAARPGRGTPAGRGPASTGKPRPAPAPSGPPAPSGAQPQPWSGPRHAAPPPLPGGGSARPGRHAAPPPLPADDRPQRPARSTATPPLPVTRPRHAAPPPLPARQPRHAAPPPLPWAPVPPPAPPARPSRRRS